MAEINKNLLFVFLLIVFLWWVFGPRMEGFDSNSMEFVPLGVDRYGLRGDKLRRSSIDKYFYSPNRKVRLSHSNAWMYQGHQSPTGEGVPGCYQVPCPQNGGYDNLDTCWKCGSQCPTAMKIPAIHPHS